jgi:hypothetical protein
LDLGSTRRYARKSESASGWGKVDACARKTDFRSVRRDELDNECGQIASGELLVVTGPVVCVRTKVDQVGRIRA